MRGIDMGGGRKIHDGKRRGINMERERWQWIERGEKKVGGDL